MTDFIDNVSTLSSDVPVIGNITAFLGDILQAGYDFITGLVPEAPADPEVPEDPKDPEN
jgi:hypothetical protein